MIKRLIFLAQTKNVADVSHHLKSKTGQSLYFVFGMTEKVKQFDKHHNLFKDFRYSTLIVDLSENKIICIIK